MKNHSLTVKSGTTARNLDEFLRKIGAQGKSCSNLHVRAYEKTVIENGKQRKVPVLFVRSGRETPFEWIRNTWNRKSQYALAAKVLNAVGGFETDPAQKPYIPCTSRPSYHAASPQEREKQAKQLITVSSLLETVP